jgi:hypothetical protein
MRDSSIDKAPDMISCVTVASPLMAFVLGASIATAQQPVAPAVPAVPQHTCVKPEFPGALADSRRFDRFNKEYKAYAECIKKYVDETKVLSDAIVEAGNKAIKEFNTFSEELAERQAAKK